MYYTCHNRSTTQCPSRNNGDYYFYRSKTIRKVLYIAVIRYSILSGVHLAPHCKKQQNFERLSAVLLGKTEVLSKSAKVPPTKLETIRDHFEELVGE